MTRPFFRGGVSWDLLLVLSLLGAVAASWLTLSVPKNAPAKAGASLKKIEESIRGYEESSAAGERAIASRTWDLSPEALASEVLAKVSQIAAANRLQVVGFRAGRTVPAASLLEVTFVVVLEGTFLDVMETVVRLESPESKVAVSQLRIASKSDLDQVTATLGLTGFIFKEAN